MDPGVFYDPGIGWVNIGIAVACAWICVASVFTGTYLHDNYIGGDELLGVLATVSFIAIWPFLGFGLAHSNPDNDCLDTKYASEGVYVVEGHRIINNSNGDDRPKLYEMELRGNLADMDIAKQDPDALFVRCIKIGYGKVLANPELSQYMPKYAIKHLGDIWEFKYYEDEKFNGGGE